MLKISVIFFEMPNKFKIEKGQLDLKSNDEIVSDVTSVYLCFRITSDLAAVNKFTSSGFSMFFLR